MKLPEKEWRRVTTQQEKEAQSGGLLCVVVCCSVLQYVAVCCSVLQCGAARCRVLQCVAVRAQRTQENEAQSRGLIAEGPPAHELRFKLLLHIIFTKLIETQQR